MGGLERVLRHLLAAGLLIVAGLKLAGGGDADFSIPSWALQGVALLEIALAILLVAGFVAVPCVGVWCVVAGGLIWSLVSNTGTGCGCLGSLSNVDTRLQMLMGGTFAALAGCVAMLRLGASKERPASGATA